MFKRSNFYSKTEACKKFKLKPEEFELLISINNIPVITNDITTADYSSNQYSIVAKYVSKVEFNKLVK